MVSLRLCRADLNLDNAILDEDGRIRFIDWECSGWGDLALELAELRWHPKSQMITDEQWNWLWENYEIPAEDKALHLRREIYEHLILIWWCLRTLQYIIERATGRGKRLVDISNISLEEKREQFWYYFEMATNRYLNKP